MEAKRKAMIEKRVKDMPSIYRSTYRKATRGKSLRAAINSQCLECCQWQRVEVRDCTALACPLYAVRPYQSENQGHDGPVCAVESTNAPKTVCG